jgi:hypothetical protein
VTVQENQALRAPQEGENLAPDRLYGAVETFSFGTYRICAAKFHWLLKSNFEIVFQLELVPVDSYINSLLPIILSVVPSPALLVLKNNLL